LSFCLHRRKPVYLYIVRMDLWILRRVI
jgi:hypothetical protein